jgi:hypothetical protein
LKVQGTLDPGKFSVEQIPGTDRSLVRLYQNVAPIQRDRFNGYEYDEYHVEVDTWDGVAQIVGDNYDVFLAKGIDNEVDRSNDALRRAQEALATAANQRITAIEDALCDLDAELNGGEDDG